MMNLYSLKIKKILNLFGRDTKQFLSHSKNYVTGDFFSKGLVFISIPIYTRLLTTSEYGVLSLYLSFYTLFSIILNFGIIGSITRYYFEETTDFNEFLGSNVTFLIIVNACLIFVFYLLAPTLARAFNVKGDILFYSILTSSFVILFNTYTAFLVAIKDSRKFALLNIVKNLIVLILSVFLILELSEDKYLGRVYAQILIFLIFSIYSFFKFRQFCLFTVRWKYLKYSLLLGLPLIFHSISAYILGTFDQIIINQLMGEKYTGLYSFAYQIGMIIQVIIIGSFRSYSPATFDMLNKSNFKGVNTLTSNYISLIFSFSIILILFSKEIVIIFADKKYSGTVELIPIIILGYSFFFLYQLYSNVTFFMKQTTLLALATVVAGIINVILNYMFIPIYGIKAAAYNTAISFFLLFFFHYLNKLYIIKEKHLLPLRMLFPGIFVVCISLISNNIINSLCTVYYYNIIGRFFAMLFFISLLNIKKFPMLLNKIGKDGSV